MASNDSSPLGRCTRVIDEIDEVICNRPGFDEVLVRNKFALFVATLCEECKLEHEAFYTELKSRSRRNRGRASQSRGRSKRDDLAAAG